MEQTADECFEKGNQEFKKKNFDFALGYYCMTITADSNYYKAYFKKGLIFYEKKMPEKAIENFDNAIKIKPDFAEAYYHKGDTYNFLLENKEEAIKQYLKVVELCPKVNDLHVNAAIKEVLTRIDLNKPKQAKVFVLKGYKRLIIKRIYKKPKPVESFFVKMPVNKKSNARKSYHNTLYFRILRKHKNKPSEDLG